MLWKSFHRFRPKTLRKISRFFICNRGIFSSSEIENNDDLIINSLNLTIAIVEVWTLAHSFPPIQILVNMRCIGVFEIAIILAGSRNFSRRSPNTILWIFSTISSVANSISPLGSAYGLLLTLPPNILKSQIMEQTSPR